MTTAFITHRDCWLHDMGPHHPECPARLGAIQDRLIAAGLDVLLSFREAPLARMEELERVHSRRYIETIDAISPEEGLVFLDPDTAMCPHTWRAALRAAGAGVLATDLVMRGEAANAFCAVRPPGHHALPARAMGFCFFNNIAVAACHAIEHWGLRRVAIVDFDVHHGNGTEEVFADDDRVLMVGTFQHPYYPYSGTEDPAGNMCNVPIEAGTRGDHFREIVSDIWMPRLRAFEPELICISAGFDAHAEDDMGGIALVDADYAWVTEQLKIVGRDSARGRIVSMLEGGYALSALGRSVSAHIKVLVEP